MLHKIIILALVVLLQAASAVRQSGQDGLEGIDCIDRLMMEFIERVTVKGLDTTCVQSIHRKGFATE